MRKRIVRFLRHNLLGQVIASLSFLLISVGVVKAVTTISSDVATDGNVFSSGGGLFNVASSTALNVQNGSGTTIFSVGTSNGISGIRATGTTDILVRFSNSTGTNDIFRLFDNTVSVFAVADGGVASGTTLRLQEGAVGTPAFSFANDSDTGVYSSAANTLDVATGGGNRLSLAASGITTSATTTITQTGEQSKALVLTAASSGRANLLENLNSSSTFVSGFTAAGGFLLNVSSTTAFVIQNGSGTTRFVVASATGNATTSGLFVTGSTNPVGPNTAGDALFGGNVTSTKNYTFTGATPFIQFTPAAAGDKLSFQSGTTTLASLDIGGTFTSKGPQNQNGTPDVAEYILTRALHKGDRLPEMGDVVAIDKQNAETAVLATRAYSSSYLGIIADGNSGLTNFAYLGDNPNARPLALAGRVKVKVTSENGVVRPGDFVTGSATKPGYAMKATRPGYVIGKALGPVGSDGTVLVFISNIYAGEIGE